MKLPEQRDDFPYTELGYDLTQMVELFAGYGKDVNLQNGIRFSAISQMELSVNFLMTVQRYFSDWTVNDIAIYCFVMKSTIMGELVSVKDISHELDMPMSTASHVTISLEGRNILQSYPCTSDKRVKWIRLHPRVIETREEGRDIWEDQRALLKKLLMKDNAGSVRGN